MPNESQRDERTIETLDDRDRTDGGRPFPFGGRGPSLQTSRWPRVVGVAALVALVATILAGFLSRGRTDPDLVGDLAALWLGIVATIVLWAGIDDRLTRTSRTLARWLSLMAFAYALAALLVVVVAAVA